jgi:hypothetical protein
MALLWRARANSGPAGAASAVNTDDALAQQEKGSLAMPRKQLLHLSYSELAELAVRLNETSETIRNPAVRADLLQAAGAVSDLASIKFGVEEIADKIIDHAFETQSESRVAEKEEIVEFAGDFMNYGAELLSLIGKDVEQ